MGQMKPSAVFCMVCKLSMVFTSLQIHRKERNIVYFLILTIVSLDPIFISLHFIVLDESATAISLVSRIVPICFFSFF